MANTTRIKDLSAVTSVADSDVLPVDGANGTKGVTFGNLAAATLGKLASKTFGLDQGTKSLPDAVNELYKGKAMQFVTTDCYTRQIFFERNDRNKHTFRRWVSCCI